MPCIPFSDASGKVQGLICGPGLRKRCYLCGQPHEVLCDARLPGRTGRAATCNRPLCRACAYHMEPDTDYCQAHRPA